MASTVAARLVAAQSLSVSEELCIPMRAQTRTALAPSAGGGRSTTARTAPKLNAIEVDPATTCILEFAKLL
eukprot:4304188-Pleurochrysis_carterae.AAC.1